MRERDDTETKAKKDERSLRWASDHLSLWRVCANQACRRARRCRGCAFSCADRNAFILPQGVRDWFAAFISAKMANVAWEDFFAEMEFSEEAEAYFAWTRLAESETRGRRPVKEAGKASAVMTK